MKKLTAIVAITFVLSITPVFATYSGGSGTQVDPYRIADANGWRTLMATSTDWSKYFILTADVNLAGVSLTPVGNSSRKFNGVFDGNGHIIRNATINLPATDYVGLFGYVLGASGKIKNLGVEDANITGKGYVGGLIGWNSSGSSVTNCYATGSVSGTGNYVGGLVGNNYTGTVTSCYASGSVNGTNHVGGLVGDSDSGNLTNSCATGYVSGTGNYVGGLVGYNFGSVTNCYATGNISGGGDVGGLVGVSYSGNLTDCYATGSVSGTGDYVGGLVGWNYGGSVTNCYATGYVSGNDKVGGLAGYNYGSVTNCYATGSVNGTSYVGGLVGINIDFSYSVTASFWDTDTSGQGTSSGGTGKTTTEMKTESTFTNAGWDFVNEKANGTEGIWHMPYQATGYPMLFWQRDIPGDFLGHYSVNFVDYAVFANAWLSTPSDANWNPLCDLHPDNVIDTLDLQILVEHWLAGL